MRFLELLRLGLGSVRRTPLRVSLTALGVAIGAGALVSMVAFALGFQEQVEGSLRRLELLNRIEVSRREAAPGGEEGGRPLLDDEALRRFASLPGVQAAYPEFRIADVQVARGDRREKAYALGLPPELGSFGFVRGLLAAGRFLRPDAPEKEVVLGIKLLKGLDIASREAALGERLILKASGLAPGEGGEFRFEEREMEVVVVGVYEPPPMAFGIGGGAVLLPLELIRELPGSRFQLTLDRLREGEDPAEAGYRQAVVRVRDPSDVPRVEREIRALGYETRTIAGEIREMRTFFLLLDVLLAAVGTVALVVAGLGIVNTQLMAVLERTREIGALKAIGASDGDVRVLFLGEAALVGLLGGLGGILLGRAVSWLLELGVNGYARSQGVEEPVAVFAFPLWLLAGAVVFVLAISVGSGVHPASRAARIDPIRALRSE